MTKACKHCGEKFETKYDHAKFCSTAHRVAAHQKKPRASYWYVKAKRRTDPVGWCP